MCLHCNFYEDVCLVCGEVKGTYKGVGQAYKCERKNLKNIVDTNDSNNFVWIMIFRGTPVKIGVGGLRKLYNETLPNPKYCRFDEVLIYYIGNKQDRHEFACWLCWKFGESIVNRQGWRNYRFCTLNDLILPGGCSNSFEAFGDACFHIGDTPYWDYYDLAERNIQRRKYVV